MERILKKANYNRIRIRMQEVCVFALSAGIALLPFYVGWLFLFPYLTYSYVRDKKEFLIGCVAILVTCGLYDVESVSFYALGMLCLYLFLQILVLKQQNLYQWLPYTGVMICLPYALQVYGLQPDLVFVLGFLWLFFEELCTDFDWLKQDAVLGKAMFALVLCAFGVLVQVYAMPYGFYAQMLIMGCIALLCNVKLTVLFGFLLYFKFQFPLPWFLYYVGICLYQGKSVGLIAISLFFGLQYVDHILGLLFLAGMCIVFAFEQKQDMEKVYQQQRLEPLEQGRLKRQMQNFSYIFEVLSNYYETISAVECEVLSSMAEALKLSAEELALSEQKHDEGEMLLKTLQAHQFEVMYLQMEEDSQGYHTYDIELKKMEESEVHTTILPLMEQQLHRKLKIIEIRKKHWFSSRYQVVMKDRSGFTFDTYADSIKNQYETSGDCFSIFQFQDYVLCTISDGMGNGEKAAASSRLITNLFQRMIVSGFRQETSIQCINKLMQSDHFATLDVLCFHKNEGVVYLSKAAACPTFLIRDDHVYQINGNSLPVGIVSKIQPDCFKVVMKEDDEYVMVSDGVDLEEVREWIFTRRKGSAKEDVETFRKILLKKKRDDDSTVVLAKVNPMNNRK